jgi:hypothetical protein
MGYDIRWQHRGVVKRFHGRLTSEDMLQSVVDIEADPRFDDLRWVINDFLAVTEVACHAEVVDDISAIDAAAAMSNPHIRIAVVTDSPAITAMATQYAESDMNAYPTRIFPTFDDATDWLDESSGWQPLHR